MNIHEYQARELFARYGIPVGNGEVATSVAQAGDIAQRLTAPYIIKAQIHSGGRGKAGGVKLASTLDDVETISRQMLGSKLVTRQTGPDGKTVTLRGLPLTVN